MGTHVSIRSSDHLIVHRKKLTLSIVKLSSYTQRLKKVLLRSEYLRTYNIFFLQSLK